MIGVIQRKMRGQRRRRITRPEPAALGAGPQRVARPFSPDALAVVALAVATALAFVNAAPDALPYDDANFVGLARHARWGLVAELFQRDSWSVVSQAPTGLYRPLSLSTIVLEGFVHGGDARELHVTAIALHVAATLTLFGFLRALLSAAPSGAKAASRGAALLAPWVAALVFAIHPVNTEAVDSFYNRSEALVVIATFGALWLLWAHGDRRPVLAWSGAAAAYFAAMLCKESATTMPALLLLALALLRPEGTSRERIRRVAPVLFLALPLAVYAVLHARATPWPAWAPPRWEVFRRSETWAERYAMVASTLGQGLELLVWPHPLRCSYDEFTPHGVTLASWLHATVVTLGVVARKRWPSITVGIGAFYIGMLPSSRLLQDFSLFPGVFAERWLYLPAAALAIPLAFGLAWLAEHRGPGVVRGLGLALYVVLVPVTWLRNEAWHGNVQLFEADYRTDPTNGTNAANLCAAYLALGRLQEGAALCDEFLRDRGEHAMMLDRCGSVYERSGREEDAGAAWRRAWESRGLTHAVLQLARWDFRRGNREAAEEEYRLAVNRTKDPLLHHVRKGEMLVRLHPESAVEARAELDAALALDPKSEAARGLVRELDAALHADPAELTP